MNPQETLQQLGGRQFVAMTGAKNFVFDDKNSTISFKIGRGAKNGINRIRIRLNAMDTYDVHFIRVWGTSITIKDEVEGIYCDQLRSIFEDKTGLYTKL